jgi:hypothetical protein
MDLNVKVAVRCRPMSSKETARGCNNIISMTPSSVHIKAVESSHEDKDFTFDHCYFTGTYWYILICTGTYWYILLIPIPMFIHPICTYAYTHTYTYTFTTASQTLSRQTYIGTWDRP